MLSAAYARTLLDYSEWATARLLGAAAGLAPAELTAAPIPGHGTLHQTLAHTFGAERLWRERLLGGSITPYLTPAEVPSVEAMRDFCAAEYAAWRELLAGFADADMARPIAYTSLNGTPFTQALWALLSHLANHGTQHRAEVAAILTALGRSPGDLDMIVFYRERGF